MKILNAIKLLATPRQFAEHLIWRLSPLMKNDEKYLKLLYRIVFATSPDFQNPETFNEKLNWMKLHYWEDIFTVMADKYAVKELVAEKIGREYVVENYGVWNSVEEIDFDNLPDSFVLKCTHNSGGVVICPDKSKLDKEKVLAALSRDLKKNYFPQSRETVYKKITPRILADRLLPITNGDVLLDYKFWCFDGKPVYMYITVKNDNIFENFYDMDFKQVEINHGFPRFQPEFSKPESFELMKELAAKLSAGIPFVRIDFFEIAGHPYFGEFTFYDWGGEKAFANLEMDRELGRLIKLPISRPSPDA